MTREDFQRTILNDNNPKVLIEMATGTGKTLTAISLIEKYGGNWGIVVAETAHINNWKEEFKKWNKEHLLSKVTIFCYASLHKYLNLNNYVFDETHHLFAPKKILLLHKINKTLERFIGLSATVTRYQKDKLRHTIGDFKEFKLSLSEAIDHNILPEPKIFLLGIDLTDYDRICKYHFTKEKYIMLSELEWYNKKSDQIDRYKSLYFETRNPNDERRWMMAALQRKNFLSDVKTRYARILIRKLQNRRLITFCGSIAQAESLGAKLALHSKLSKEKQDVILTEYLSGTTNNIFVKGMLKEGINIPGIEAGIIVQLDNNTLNFVQKLGRSLRSDSPEQYVLYVKNTQDSKYVDTALEGFNMEYVKFIDFKEFYEKFT